MADQIERVELLARLTANFFGQRFKEHAFVGQFVDDGLLFLGIVPAPQKSSSELNSLASVLRV